VITTVKYVIIVMSIDTNREGGIWLWWPAIAALGSVGAGLIYGVANIATPELHFAGPCSILIALLLLQPHHRRR
jgi:K+ transporter